MAPAAATEYPLPPRAPPPAFPPLPADEPDGTGDDASDEEDLDGVGGAGEAEMTSAGSGGPPAPVPVGPLAERRGRGGGPMVRRTEDGGLEVAHWLQSGLAAGRSAAGAVGRRRQALQQERGVPVDFILKVAGVLTLRHLNRRAFRRVEFLAYALPLPMRRLHWAPARAAGVAATGMVKAVVTVRILVLADLLLDRLWRRLRGRGAESPDVSASASPEAHGRSGGSARVARPSSVGSGALHLQRAVDIAAKYHVEMQEMKSVLEDMGITELPPDRFREGDAELCRFAGAHGLTKEEPQAVVRGAQMVEAFLGWRASYPFMVQSELRRWEHLVRLAGRDEEGRPVVVMHLGPALRLPRDKAAGFVVAIISVVDIVVTGLLGDEPGHPENLTTVLDVAGCGMMQVSSSVGVMKQVITILTANYPARLARLCIVDPPRIAQWALQVLYPFIPPVTRKKLVLCSASDPRVPIDLVALRNGGQPAESSGSAQGAAAEESSDASSSPTVPPSPFATPATQRAADGLFTPQGLPSLRRPLPAADAGSARRQLHPEPRTSTAPEVPAVPPLDLPKAGTAEGRLVAERMQGALTPHSLSSGDLTTVLYLFIAVAGCSFLGQQAGITPQQVMQVLQKYVVWMTKTLQLE
mmetsp:Transcript_31675/g.81151  ORF Transcript_31675/g.81151 Transcript_31675/m.81151 type:complete len:639 (+) Transcript_31675:89-2005(+)